MNKTLNSLYTASQVRELDKIIIQEGGVPGLTLMQRAARACAQALLEHWPAPGKVAVLCGSGNNAGDGFILAGLLAAKGIEVEVALVGRAPADETDAGRAIRFCRESKVPLVQVPTALQGAGLIVDALLGTGLNGQVRPAYAEAIARANNSGLPILAVDLPSGLCPDTGNLLGETIKADVTVTFIGRKFGLLTNNGPEQTGKLIFAGLDVPDSMYAKVEATAGILSYETLAKLLKPRHRNTHKVSHGRLLVVGGDEGMAGAASLAAEAALYAGAGMVQVATRQENVAGITARRPEVMAMGIATGPELDSLVECADAVVLGPGLGRKNWGRDLFNRIMETRLPLVVDADGLNLLAEKPQHRDNWILTPHPGEAERLLHRSPQADRLAAVRQMSGQYGGTFLLKGAGTLVCGPGGKVDLCPYGNPGMSVAGMGDLLAGVIGGLLAQGIAQDGAARLGAVVHSLAADELVKSQGERGLLASELLPGIRRLVNPV